MTTATGHPRFKLDWTHFRAAWEAEKKAEVREVDMAKPIEVGSYVWLDEWIPAMPFRGAPSVTQYVAHHTGRCLLVLVTHIVTHDDVPDLLPYGTHVWSFQIVQRHDPREDAPDVG